MVESVRMKPSRGLLRQSNHHNKGWGCHTVLGFCLKGSSVTFTWISSVSQLPVSTLSLHNITTTQIFLLRFVCQTSYTISDKNNGLLQPESQVSEHWTNTRQQCFLGREDDQGGTAVGSKDLQTGFNGKMLIWFSLCSPPLLSQRDCRENVDPDQLMVYDTKKTFPDSCSLRPPWCRV